MHDERYATGSQARQGPRRSGSVRWLVVCAAALVSSCQPAGVLDPQGPIASAQRLLLFNATAIMLVVVVPVILATLGFAWWSGRQTLAPAAAGIRLMKGASSLSPGRSRR